jgi:hypothetical protein
MNTTKYEQTNINKKIEVLKCNSCETQLTLETAISCDLCDREDDNDGWDEDKISPLFCKKCTDLCNACEVRGCKKCVTFACCDCGYDMCYNCRYDEIDCGCYGHCYSCGMDVNRGEDGWPCGECEKWYCCNCIQGNNPCKECGPEEEEEEEEN